MSDLQMTEQQTAPRCLRCGQVGMDDCEVASCTWEQWSDGTPVTAKQQADGAAFADRVNDWLARREQAENGR